MNNGREKKGRIGDRFRKVTINRKNIREYNHKEYTKILTLGLFLLVIICGTSYAFLSTVIKSNKTIEVVSGVFKIDFLESNAITLKNAAPISDTDGMSGEPYTFTISNTGTLDAKYDISIEEKDDNTLDRKYVKYSIKEGDGEWSNPALLSSGLSLKNGRILASGSDIKYQLKFWLDEGADNSAQGKNYSAKIVVNSVQTNSSVEDITTPVIVLNGESSIDLLQGETFTDPGVSSVKDDKDTLNIENVSKSYEYYDGENTVSVDNIDTTKLGTYYIYYKISDSNNNIGTTVRCVNIYKKDTNPPTISLIGDELVTLEYGSKYTETYATATDKEDGNLDDKIVVVGKVNTKKAGTYIIKYLVEDKEGNTASITRTVVVLPSEGVLTVDVENITKEEDVAESKVEITTSTDAENVLYALTSEDKKPADDKFSSIDELNSSMAQESNTYEVNEKAKVKKLITDNNDSNIKLLANEENIYTKVLTFTANGTYYLWIKDSNGNITKKKIIIDNIDRSKPSCKFNSTGYVGINSKQNIELVCTDIVDIREKYLTEADFTISDSTVASILSVSTPTKVTNGYRWVLNVNGLKDGSFTVILPKDKVSDKVQNKNDEVTSSLLKTSELKVDSQNIDLDINGTKTHNIITSGNNLGDITYESEDSSIASVSKNGIITAEKVGITKIIVTEANGLSKSEITVNVEKTVTATFTKNGTGVVSLGSTSASCKITDTNSDCLVTRPDFVVMDGYTAIGFNTDKTAHVNQDLVITDDTTYYTISKKNEITLNANFMENGAILSNGDTSCVIPEVFNDEIQETSCSIVAPTITASDNTPIVVGFSSDANATTAEFLSGSNFILNAGNSNKNYYAITKNNPITYKATFSKNGAGVATIGATEASCTIPSTYNGTVQNTKCSVKAPAITVNDGYSIIGWSADKNSHEGVAPTYNLDLSGNTNFYTITKQNSKTLTVTFIQNGTGVTSISKKSVTCTLDESFNDEEQATNCSIDLPTITVEKGYTAIGWNTVSTAKSGVTGSININKDITYYSISKKNAITLTADFNGNGATLSSGNRVSCVLNEAYNNDVQPTSCSIDTPTITREEYAVIGFSKNKNATTSDISIGTLELDNTNTGLTWYAITSKDIKMIWSGNGSTISSTSSTCTMYNIEASCSITSPTITRSGYTIVGWGTDSNATESSWNQGVAKAVSASATYYAVIKKDIVITFNKNGASTQTNSSGVAVSDATVSRSCTIYNTATSCSVTSPAIVGVSTTPTVVGYGTSADATESSWNQSTAKTVNANATYYAITRNSAKTLTATFKKSGTGVSAIGGTTASCTISVTYNGENQASSCTVKAPTISVSSGYTGLGWNTNSTATNGTAPGGDITLTSDTTYYSISKKNAVTLTATFNKNGATSQTVSGGSASTAATVTQSCTLPEVYNSEIQDTSCSVTSPKINASAATPTVLGYSTGADTHTSSWNENTVKDISASATYYAQTTKEKETKTATFATNGATSVSSGSESCSIEATYNGEEQATNCSVTSPTITRSGYTIIGFNTNKDAKTSGLAVSTKVNISNDITYYAITSKANEITWNGNGGTTSTPTSTCTMYNIEASCSITSPTITRSGYTIVGWGTDSNATESSWNQGVAKAVSASATYYAVTKKDIVITFNKNGASTQTNSSGVAVSDATVSRSCTIYNTATSCSVTSPAIVGVSTTPTVVGYGTSADATESSWNQSTAKTVNANATYYAITRNSAKTLTATFKKSGTGVSAIGATSVSCTIDPSYNGASQKTSCTVKTPTISVLSGYTGLGWNTDSTATSGTAPGGAITLTSDETYYSISKKNAVTLTATFNKNGATSQTVSGGSASTDATVTQSCTIPEVYNSTPQATSCSVTSPTIAASTNTPTVLGYGTSASSTIATLNVNTAINISGNVTYYAVTKKDAVTLTATFNKNGAASQDENTSATISKQCVLGTAYNGAVQATNCSVTSPTIVGSSNTPTVIGYSTASGTHSNEWSQNTAKTISGNVTYYAQTKKGAVTFNATYEKGSHVSAIGTTSGSCNIGETYNGTAQAKSCSVTGPSITASTGYTSVGWSTTTGATTGATSLTLTKDTTYYANAVANSYTIEYYNGTTSLGTTGAKVDTNVTLTSASTLGATKTGYTFKGWDTSTSGTTVVYGNSASVKNLSTTAGATVKLYAVFVDDIAPSCTWSSGATTTTANTTTQTLTCTDQGSGMNSQTLATTNFATTANGTVTAVSAPTAVTNGYKYTVTVRGNSVGTFTTSLNATTISDKAGNKNATSTSSNVTVNGRVYTATWTKNGTGVSGIGATSTSCTTTGSSTSCSVTSPSITVASGYEAVGWNTSQTATSGTAAGGSLTISANTTYYSISYKNAITYTATFNKNGAASQTVSGGSASTADTVTQSCTIPVAYNSTTQATSCNVTSPSITGATNTPSVYGYSTASGTHSSSWNVATTQAISGNVTYYAQTYKASVTRTATFNANGATSISGTSISCTIGAIYNGNSGAAQATSCTPTAKSPTITRSGYTIVGWGTSAGATSSSLAVDTAVSLSSNPTYYAVTYKRNTITWNDNGATVDPASSYCDQYNTATSCNVTSPAITRSGYSIIGFNTTTSATTSSWNVSTAKTISASATYYAITYKAAVTLTATFNKNGATSQTVSGGSASTATTVSQTCQLPGVYNTATPATSCSVTSPTITASTNTPSVTGYSTAAGTHSNEWSQNAAKSISGNVTYYAQTYKAATSRGVTFDANGATLSGGSSSCTIGATYNGTAQGDSCTVTAPAIARSGYTIVGYNTTESSTTSALASGGTLTISSTNNGKTYYAVTNKVITITFNKNGAASQTDSNGTKSTAATVTRACTMWNKAGSCSVTSPTIEGSTNTPSVCGYNTASTGTTTCSWGHNTAKTVSANATWNAITYKAAVTRTITYKAGSNVSAIGKTSDSCNIGATYNGTAQSANCSVTLTSITPSTGYTATGWYNGSTKAGNAGASYSASSNVTLTANSSANTYTGTLNANGGTNASTYSSTFTATYNNTYNLDSYVPTRTGYSFAGWYSAASGGSKFTGDWTWTSAGNYTFYAQWTINNYYFDVNPDTGIASFDISLSTTTGLTDFYQQKPYGTQATITNVKAKSGFTYSGYSVGGSMTKISDSSNSTIKLQLGAGNGSVALTSTRNNYTATYNCTTNGGSTANSSATVAYEGAVDLTKTCTKSGWTFVGWNTSSSATTALSSYSMPASNTTLYAIYRKEAITRKATFNTNGATSISATSISCTIPAVYNTATQATSCTPTAKSPTITRSGYTIVGWGTSTGATSSSLAVDTAVSLSSNPTYYAVTYKKNTVTFSGNGASINATSASCNQYNTATGCNLTTATITRSGFTIVGFNQSNSATASTVPAATVITVNTDSTLYAITKKGISMAFNANGNTISKTSDSCTIWNSATTCNMTSPTITPAASTPNVIGFSTAAGTHSGEWGVNISKGFSSGTTYYAQTVHYGKSLSASMSKSTGVSSIDSTSQGCTISATFNGASWPGICYTTLPTATASTGYSTPYWLLRVNGSEQSAHFANKASASIYESMTTSYTAYAYASGIVPTVSISSSSGMNTSARIDGMTTAGCSNSSSVNSSGTWILKSTNVNSHIKSGSTSSNAGTATIRIGSTNVGTVTMTSNAPYDNIIVKFTFSCGSSAFKSAVGPVFISIPAGVLVSNSSGVGNASTTIDTGMTKTKTA